MKINIEVLFVILLIIVNLLIGGIFLYLIFTVDAPEMYAEISIAGLSSEEIRLDTKLDIENPNLFDLVVKNIKVTSVNNDGDEFASFNFGGGEVSGGSKKSFSTIKSIELNGNVPRVLENRITADVGVRFLGIIERNLPIEVLAIVSLDEFLDDLKIPDIFLEADIEDLTEDGLFFSADIEVTNENDIELIVDDIAVDLKTEEGINVGKIEINGGTLAPRSKLNLDTSGNILFKALDAKRIDIDLIGKATANIAGISQSLNLSASAALNVPNLEDLLNLKNESFDFSLFGEFKLRLLRGIIATVTFDIHNPSKIPLVAKDLVCHIYGITDENRKLVAEEIMEDCEVEAENDVCVVAKLNIPYIKLLTSGTGRIAPQWIAIVLDGYLAFEGTNQTIPISINGNLDPHIFK